MRFRTAVVNQHQRCDIAAAFEPYFIGIFKFGAVRLNQIEDIAADRDFAGSERTILINRRGKAAVLSEALNADFKS